MATNFTRHPSTNPAYPFVGDNYIKLGEQPGYIYHPYTDKYYVDPKAVENQYKKQGHIKGDPSLMQQIAPLAAATGGVALAKTVGTGLPGYIKEGIAGAKGLFGIGSSAPAAGGVAGSAGAGLTAPTITGAEMVTGAAPSGLLGIGALPLAAIAAGTFLGGKSAYDMIRGKKDNSIQGKIGRTTLGIATGGLSEIARRFIKNGDEYKREGNALMGLSKKGTYVPQNLIDDAGARKKGRSKEELVQQAQRTGGNVKFAESRNEGDLTGADIANYSAFAANDPEWFRKPVEERIAFAQKALDAGAVREHHGTIDVDWKKLKGEPQKPIGEVTPGTTPGGLLNIGKKR